MIEKIQYQSLQWLDITNPSEDDYRVLLDEYHFHPLDIEDCRGTNQRPKIDEYDDYYFLILHFPYFDKGNKFIRIREVKIFWGRDYIITVGKAHWVVKKFFDEINDDIFNRRARSIIEQISVTRRNVILLNTTFRPQLRVLHMFESGGIKGFVDPELIDMEDYWGNILDQYQKMFDSIEDYGELIEGLSQTFDSLLTNRTNEIMRVLTYFSTIMLPLTVVTGFFGMNVDFPFTPNTVAFWVILGSLVLISGGIVLYLRRINNR